MFCCYSFDDYAFVRFYFVIILIADCIAIALMASVAEHDLPDSLSPKPFNSILVLHFGIG